MVTVEQRIILITAQNAQTALKKANTRGASGESSFVNDDGNHVFIEFIGVLDLMHLGIECEEDTVWYEIKTMADPMSRKKKLIPSTDGLSAIKLEKRNIGAKS